MAASLQIQHLLTSRGSTSTKSVSKSGTGVAAIDDESVATAETDYEIALSVDVSAIQAFWLNSTQDVSFQTNNGGAPDDTIALIANEPLVWWTGSPYTNLLTTDITAVFITNVSGSTATIRMDVVVDATP